MARKAPHIHRFTSLLYPLQWHYFLWKYPTDKWTDRSTQYPLSRNEIPYPPRTFKNLNMQKTHKAIIFWQLINNEIEDMIKKYPTCLTFWNCKTSEPIINHPIPNQVWTKTAASPFWLYRHYYLVMIGYYYKFIVIEMLKKSQ